MTGLYINEVWKTVVFDFEYTNKTRIEVSNFGRLRSFNKTSDGNFLKPSLVNGYPIIRLKLFKPRDKETDNKLQQMKAEVFAFVKQIKQMRATGALPGAIAEAETTLAGMRKRLSKKFAASTRQRTFNYHSLIHRLVAANFLPKPDAQQTIVAHLDFDKLNNRASNLKWMSPEENYKHQQNSPYVISDKHERKYGHTTKTKISKLSVTKVMLLKKMLNQGKPMKTLVKQFKITETQILRIKRGENWGNIDAAT